MKFKNFIIGFCFILFYTLTVTVFAVNSEPTTTITVPVEQWTDADNLFRNNSHWRGADGAYSIQLDSERVLWMFGDTLVSNKNNLVPRTNTNTAYPPKCPRNSVGIQTGLDPSTATIKYYWKENNSITDPISFFRSPYIAKANWLWPGDFTLLPDGKTLVMFFMNIYPTDIKPFYFDIAGYQVAIIRNSNETPDKWEIEWVEKVSSYLPWKILVGSGGVLVDGDYLYAFGYSSLKDNAGVCLARWSLSVLDQDTPNLSMPQWWSSAINDWIIDPNPGTPRPSLVWDKGQTEFTVNKIKQGLYVMFEAYPPLGYMGNGDMVCRVARSLTGPWSDQISFYHTIYKTLPCPTDIMVYAGKYHPQLQGSDFIFTYATNTSHLKSLWLYEDIYYPRFLKINSNTFIEQLEQYLPPIEAKR